MVYPIWFRYKTNTQVMAKLLLVPATVPDDFTKSRVVFLPKTSNLTLVSGSHYLTMLP